MKNTLERTSCQIDLEIELDVIQGNIRKVKNPVKKNRLTRAYEGLVELLTGQSKSAEKCLAPL